MDSYTVLKKPLNLHSAQIPREYTKYRTVKDLPTGFFSWFFGTATERKIAYTDTVTETSKVSISFTCNKIVELRSTQFIFINAHIENTSRTPVDSVRLDFTHNEYVERRSIELCTNLKPGARSTHELSIKLKGHHWVSLLAKNPCIKFDLIAGNLCTSHLLRLAPQMFMERLFTFTPKENVSSIKVITLGSVGVGKTALVNEMAKTLFNKPTMSVGNSARGGHCTLTKDLTGYSFDELCANPLPLTWTFFDYRGKQAEDKLDEKISFHPKLLTCILNGQVPEVFNPEKIHDLKSELKTYRQRDPDPHRIIDYAVFVVRCDMLDKENAIKTLQEFQSIATEANRQHVVIVTHVDTMGQQAYGELLDPNNAIVKKAMELVTNIGFSKDRIFLVGNDVSKFAGERHANEFSRDLVNYTILEHILSNFDFSLKKMLEIDELKVRLNDRDRVPSRRFYFRRVDARRQFSVTLTKKMDLDAIKELVLQHRYCKKIQADRLLFMRPDGRELELGSDFWMDDNANGAGVGASDRYPVVVLDEKEEDQFLDSLDGDGQTERALVLRY